MPGAGTWLPAGVPWRLAAKPETARAARAMLPSGGMVENFRRFEAGPDPFGRTWRVELLWLQNAIAIRRADAVDVKFRITSGGAAEERVVALAHPDLLRLSRKLGRGLTDPWCMRLAATHLKHVLESGEDSGERLITPSYEELERYAAADTAAVPSRPPAANR